MVSFARPVPQRKAATDSYTLRRHIEKMDAIRRNRLNTPVQRDEADMLMFLIEGHLRDVAAGGSV